MGMKTGTLYFLWFIVLTFYLYCIHSCNCTHTICTLTLFEPMQDMESIKVDMLGNYMDMAGLLRWHKTTVAACPSPFMDPFPGPSFPAWLVSVIAWCVETSRQCGLLSYGEHEIVVPHCCNDICGMGNDFVMTPCNGQLFRLHSYTLLHYF